MKEVTLEELINNVAKYNLEGVEMVRKAYRYADMLHNGQYRESGDPYIIHPLNVAYTLSEMHADTDTLCAGLLHDTLEDTQISKEEIARDFNDNVANLVDGVTKIRGLDFKQLDDLDDDEKKKLKEAENNANTRKIITGITDDVRIIIIKLADRLHNMQTLRFKKNEMKRVENALETMEIFVPLAYSLGAYKLKNELEDLSFQHINPGKYKEIENVRKRFLDKDYQMLEDMAINIGCQFYDKGILPKDIDYRIKNVYGIYKESLGDRRPHEIPDLLSLKVIMNELQECYLALGLIHQEYHPINNRFKDYISNPKTNMYQSLHTTVFGPQNNMVQVQIRTEDMDKVASYGLTTYWDQHKGNAREAMQECLRNKYQFYESLIEINEDFKDNKEFVERIKKELFGDKIYVYAPDGTVYEFPKGSTAIDFAYKIHTELGHTMTHAIVNGKAVPPNYVLHSKDIVLIKTDDMSFGPRREWENEVKTARARKMVKEYYK